MLSLFNFQILIDNSVLVDVCEYILSIVDVCEYILSIVDVCEYILSIVNACEYILSIVDVCEYILSMVDICEYILSFVDVREYILSIVDSVSVPIIATFCPFALQVGRTSPWSNDTTDLGKGSIKLQASIVWKGWLKSFSSYRRFYRTKSIGDNKNGQPDYRHHSKRSILR